MSVTRIRDLTQGPRENAELVARPTDWARICSALDAIDDAGSAIASYANQTKDAGLGGLYLSVYGVTQAFYIQQDAIKALVECLQVDVDLESETAQWKPARDSRIDIGHPTKVYRTPQSSTSIVQNSRSQFGFRLQRIRHTGDHNIDWEYVSIPKLIGVQREAIESALMKIAKAIEQREIDHRRKYRVSPLSAAFGGQSDYYLSKFRSELDPPYPCLRVAVRWARGSIDGLRAALGDRTISELTYADIEYPVAELPYYLDKLDGFAAGANPSGEPIPNPRDVRAFAGHAAKLLEGLLGSTREIDRLYESDDPDP